MQSRLERFAPPVGAAITLLVGFGWCLLVHGFSAWLSLGAGLACGLPVYGALRLAIRRSRSTRDARGRVLGLMVAAGGLMLVAGLLALLLPGIERGGLLGAIALASAALYFGAALFELARGRGRSGGIF